MTEMNKSDLPSSEVAFYLTVYGHVQGIGFRKKLKTAAAERAVVGWVRNMRQGHVEAFLQGGKSCVQELIAGIHTGAYSAEVKHCVVSHANLENLAGFEILKQNTLEKRESLIKERVNLLAGELSLIASSTLTMRLDEHNTPASYEILSELPRRYWPEPLKKSAPRFREALRNACCSFTSELWSYRAQVRAAKPRGPFLGEILDEKELGADFSRSCGIRTPEAYSFNRSFDRIIARGDIVIKPSKGAGSNGVYLVYSENRIFDIKNKIYYSSWADLRAAVMEYLSKNRKADSWIVEEFMKMPDGSAPNDLKFYCFYGRTPLALEVQRTEKGPRYCWWDDALNRVDTGKYQKKLFDSTPFDQKYFDVISDFSLKIPTPFMRIDFFRLSDELVFGEFTPQPGNFHQFDTRTDTWLGREFGEARGRLTADLLNGKPFSEFKEFATSVASRKKSSVA